MTRKEAAGVIKFEKACVLRQDTPRCNRDCKKCDLLLPTEDVLTAYDMAIKALEQQPCEDTISRADVEQTVEDNILCYTHSDRPIDQDPDTECDMAIRMALRMLRKDLRKLPPAQPEPLSDAYMKAVWTWLLDYQIKVAKLKGRYTPYEVLSWVANDWRKEHERSD